MNDEKKEAKVKAKTVEKPVPRRVKKDVPQPKEKKEALGLDWAKIQSDFEKVYRPGNVQLAGRQIANIVVKALLAAQK